MLKGQEKQNWKTSSWQPTPLPLSPGQQRERERLKMNYEEAMNQGFPGGTSGKESTCQWRRWKRRGFDPWIGKIHWSRKWQCTPVFLPGKFHGQRSLVGYSAWDCKELDKTEYTHTHTHTNQADREGKNGSLSRTSEFWKVSLNSMLFFQKVFSICHLPSHHQAQVQGASCLFVQLTGEGATQLETEGKAWKCS